MRKKDDDDAGSSRTGTVITVDLDLEAYRM